MFEVPKMLYGPRGWADLDDYRIARNEAEEAAAAQDGYFRAGEEAQEDLVAAGKWHRLPLAPCASAEVDCEITEAFIEAGVAPPKRRGRPPKVA